MNTFFIIIISFTTGLFIGYFIKDNYTKPDEINEINNANNIIKGKLTLRQKIKIRRNERKNKNKKK